MISRTEELCRKLKPVLGRKIDALWNAYLAESDPGGRSDIEQTLGLLAAKHLGASFEPDRAPFPPPARAFAEQGDFPLGNIRYAHRDLYPFRLKSARLREHLLVAGRSGSGKTNLTFILIQGMMDRNTRVLAFDWKRGYRDEWHCRALLRLKGTGTDRVVLAAASGEGLASAGSGAVVV